MPLQAELFKKTFIFNFKARTSRGLMKDREAWFVKVWDAKAPQIFGIGECGPLPNLSIDARPELETILKGVVERVSGLSTPDISLLKEIVPSNFPSIMFAMETAFLDLSNGGRRVVFENDFIRGHKIPINGLIWM